MLPRSVCRSVAPIVAFGLFCGIARGTVLWSDLGTTLVRETGRGSDILGGTVQRDDSAHDTLYFKFHVDPLSEVGTEEYFAAFQLFEGDTERLGVGNSMKAWAYSAFNTADTRNFNNVVGDVDLHSSRQESSSPGVYLPYELPRRGIENTIVFKVQYVAGGDDLVTVWMNPDLNPGATEENQPAASTTAFNANASFNQIRIRHGGGGGGWIFSDMAIATSFSDFVASTGLDLSDKPILGKQSAALTFRAWQRDQGLPQNTVRAIAQTPEGYLWIGSDDGITRFDGVRFVPFGLPEGWHNGRVQTMVADPNGGLWIGTAAGGLVQWRDGRFTTFGTADGLPSESVSSLALDPTGQLWVGTSSGLALLRSGKIADFPAAMPFKGKAISALLRDRQGVMWIGVGGQGVFRYEQGKFVRLNDAAIEALLNDPHCLLEDRIGRMWVGAGDDFVVCREADQWRRYRLPRHLARPYVDALAEEEDGTVWAGSVSEGLFQFRNGKLTALNASSGLSDNFVHSLYVDREGNLWIGTAGGLNRLRRGNLALFGQNEGLGYGPVYGLAEVSPGQVWACKPNDGVYALRGRSFSKLSAGPAERFGDVFSLIASSDGVCRVGSSLGVLAFRNASESSLQEPALELQGRAVVCLSATEDGAAAGTRDGQVWMLKAGQWMLQTNLCQTHPVSAILTESNGACWVGTQGGGLHCYRAGVHTQFGAQRGLLSDIIRTLYIEPNGILWVGSAGGGLARIRNGKVHTFTSTEGLPDNTVSQILSDDRGRLWLGTDRGLVCTKLSDLDNVAEGQRKIIYPDIYGRPEGMPSEECTSGFFPAGLKTRSGHLWFSTTKGIVVADPSGSDGDAAPPTAVLEDILVDGAKAEGLIKLNELNELNEETHSQRINGETSGKSVAHGAGTKPALRIPAGKHSLEFHFTGLSLRAPERIRFRYRLQPEGGGAEWIEAGVQRTVSYGYLPPGEYTFSVTACNSDGVWNPQMATVKFGVMRYFWQSRWFFAVLMLMMVSVVAGIVRLVEKRRLKKRLEHLEQERAVQRERARIAQDLHDDLGSSLTRLSLLSDLIKADKEIPAQVELHASRITQSAGQTVRALEEIVWALRPGSDTLQSLVDYVGHFANELFEGDGTRCRLDFPHDLPSGPLPPEMRHNIFLIIKEALTNALKHAQAREVHVQAKILPGCVQFTVHDNGKGFVFPAASTSGNGGRHGLENMSRRADAMGAKLTVQSGADSGTTITLVVPFTASAEIVSA